MLLKPLGQWDIFGETFCCPRHRQTGIILYRMKVSFGNVAGASGEVSDRNWNRFLDTVETRWSLQSSDGGLG